MEMKMVVAISQRRTRSEYTVDKEPELEVRQKPGPAPERSDDEMRNTKCTVFPAIQAKIYFRWCGKGDVEAIPWEGYLPPWHLSRYNHLFHRSEFLISTQDCRVIASWGKICSATKNKSVPCSNYRTKYTELFILQVSLLYVDSVAICASLFLEGVHLAGTWRSTSVLKYSNIEDATTKTPSSNVSATVVSV